MPAAVGAFEARVREEGRSCWALVEAEAGALTSSHWLVSRSGEMLTELVGLEAKPLRSAGAEAKQQAGGASGAQCTYVSVWLAKTPARRAAVAWRSGWPGP